MMSRCSNSCNSRLWIPIPFPSLDRKKPSSLVTSESQSVLRMQGLVIVTGWSFNFNTQLAKLAQKVHVKTKMKYHLWHGHCGNRHTRFFMDVYVYLHTYIYIYTCCFSCCFSHFSRMFMTYDSICRLWLTSTPTSDRPADLQLLRWINWSLGVQTNEPRANEDSWDERYMYLYI